ncbi:MAG: TIGR02302 family protein [Reyranellaceae bacterium]
MATTGRLRNPQSLLRRRLALSRLSLLWEALWPRLVWPLAVLAGFFTAAYSEIFSVLPGWLHVAALAGFALAFVGVVFWQFRSFKLPDAAAVQRRLERDSNLPHRPLVALDDRLSGGSEDPATAALWRAHQERMAARLRELRNALPSPGVPNRDPLALRVVPILAVVVALVAAGGWRPDLLHSALTPHFAPPPPVGFEIWMNPPAYTRLAPRLIDPAEKEVRAPVGSKITAIVQGGTRAPVLKFGDSESEFTTVEREKFTATAEVRKGARLAIERRGSELAGWPLVVVPDYVPTVELSKDPEATSRNLLRLDYLAGDDYGVVKLTAELRRAPIEGVPFDPDAPGMSEKLLLDLPLPANSNKRLDETSYHDLTPHPWAGLPVYVTLVALDGADQEGRSTRVSFVLPERQFRNPVAQALILLRKALTRNPDDRAQVAEGLARLGGQPQLFSGDTVVYLALRMAANRLILDPSFASIGDVQKLLWETALRLEDGNLSLAERELRRAQDALQDAIDKNARDEEIERLIEELKQALNNYMRELAEQMAREGEEMVEPGGDEDRVITSEDLQRMIDRARELAQSGNRDAARQMLSELRNMLENMRPMKSDRAQRQQRNQQGQQMMNEMDRLTREQHNLLGETQRQQQGQRGQRGQQPGQGMGPGDGEGMEGSRQRQEALRRQLGDMMGRFNDMTGSIPDSLGNAERFMRDAERGLGQGDLNSAERAQRQALDALQQGMQDLAQQMQGNGSGTEEGPLAQDPQNPQRDPLGREGNYGRAVDDRGVTIPDQPARQRSREILEELRRRAGDGNRPKFELDYIERLLRQF